MIRPALVVLLAAMTAPAGAQEAPSPLARARELLVAASAAPEAEAQRLAADAAAVLAEAAEAPGASCETLVLLAEAQLRAARPQAALATLDRAGPCDPAAVFSLKGWALEHDEQGRRRGPKAPLARAEDAWMRAALHAGAQQEPDRELVATAMLRAAELSELRGDLERCSSHVTFALKQEPPASRALGLALQHLRCSSRLIGEGAALDAIHEHFDEATFLSLIDARMAELRKRLDRGHDDPHALASVAFYSLLTGVPREQYNAERYLVEAAARDENLPDLWFLMGQAHEQLGRREEAADNYRRQVRLHPGTPATRLAVNNLADVLVQAGAPKSDLEPALKLLDEEIARTPSEPAMRETRARVLLALGRRAETLAEVDRAGALSDDPAFQHELRQLREAASAPRPSAPDATPRRTPPGRQ